MICTGTKLFIVPDKKSNNSLKICIVLYNFANLIFINVTGYPQ